MGDMGFIVLTWKGVSELAVLLGVNSSLMRKYKSGLVFASAEQRKKIETGIHHLSKQLSTVRF